MGEVYAPEPAWLHKRLAGVIRVSILLAVSGLVAACGSTTTFTPTPTPSPTPAPTPASLLPLPPNLTGIPGPADTTAEVAPQSPTGELTVGVDVNYEIGHCGLSSPIDIDGSLWDPIGYLTVNGQLLTPDQEGELVNATPTVARLVDAGTLQLTTDSGLLIVLARHDGPRRYYLCD